MDDYGDEDAYEIRYLKILSVREHAISGSWRSVVCQVGYNGVYSIETSESVDGTTLSWFAYGSDGLLVDSGKFVNDHDNKFAIRHNFVYEYEILEVPEKRGEVDMLPTLRVIGFYIIMFVCFILGYMWGGT